MRVIRLAVIVLIALVLTALVVRAAVDSSTALYFVNFRALNPVSAQTDLQVPFGLSGQALVDQNFINSSGLNSVVVGTDGELVPAMPASLQNSLESCKQYVDIGATYTTYTTECNDDAVGDIGFFLGTPAAADSFLFGLQSPGRILSFSISQAAVWDADIVWYYWNGFDWTALSDVEDTSVDFTVSGFNTLAFDLPTDWAESTVDSVVSFWVRANIDTVTTTTTLPAGTRSWWQSGNWWTYADSIGQNEQVSYTLYLGGSTDFQTFHYLFPGMAGITTPDDPTIELGGTFTVEWVGYLDPDSSGDLVNKASAFRVYWSAPGVLTLAINGSDITAVTSITAAERTVTVVSDSTNVSLSVSGVGSATASAVSVTDNGSDWVWVDQVAMVYLKRILVGFPLQDIDNTVAEWNAGTLVDTEGVSDGGNGHLELEAEGEWDGSSLTVPLNWLRRDNGDSGWADCTTPASGTCFDETHILRVVTNLGTGTNQKIYQVFTASPGQAWSIQGQCQRMASYVSTDHQYVGIEFLDSSYPVYPSSVISDVRASECPTFSSVWTSSSLQNQIAPANTAYVSLNLWTWDGSGSGNFEGWWDAVIGCQCTATPAWPATSENSIVNPSFEQTHDTTGTRVSPAFNVTSVTDVSETSIRWDATAGASETVVVEFSTDAGVSYTPVSTEGPIPGVSAGDDLSGASDYHSRVTLTGSGEGTPEIDNLVVTVFGTGDVDLLYELNTMPSISLLDRSSNTNNGAFSFPTATSTSITVSQDPLRSTQVVESKQSQESAPDVADEVDPGNWQGGSFDPSNIPFNSLWATLSDLTGGDIPVIVYWVVFATWVVIFSGVITFVVTQSVPWAAAVMGLALLGFTSFGGGLFPPWIFFFFAVMAMAASVYVKVRGL